ncbi:HBS1 N-terminus-domain-containing protein [Pisolithus albus]|nr:HBS1 N-terminus-domain-containing protein [Pisolithus albus]
MSRHRLVRNINIQDDDALSDGGDEVTDEQYAQLESGLTHVRAIMGDEAISALDDGVIKDALWEHYFDVEKAVAWLYEEQGRRIAAKERKAFPRSKSRWWNRFRRKGDDEQEVHHNGQGTSSQHQLPYSAAEAEDLDRPRGPLIMLAQHGHYQPDYCPEDCMACSPDVDPNDLPMGFMPRASRLSTITELTERTEPSCHRHSRQQLGYTARASLSTDTTSSYGQVIGPRSGRYSNMCYPTPPLDPNEIPPSPSPSAAYRLSTYESAPSALPTETGSEASSDSPRLPPPSVSVPPVDTIPDIPDSLSKFSDVPPPPPEKDFPSRRQPAKRSKLATLASSRASTVSSSRSSALETTSVLTYPALRPSPESRLSYASRATTVKTPPSENSEGTIRGIPPPSEKSASSARTPSTTPSSMSSHVRRAIDKAMELEQQNGREEPAHALAKSLSNASISTAKPLETSPSLSGGTPEKSVVRDESVVQSRPQSKLAKLAQAKANGAVPLIPKSIPRPSPVSLPKPRTEYLTPIANGATATTAITTSYQTLHSLSTSRTPQPVPPVQMTGTTEAKQSKLASKAKKAQAKPSPHSSATDDEGSTPTQSPLFLSKSCHSRALPSAFASLLLDDRLTSPEADKHRKSPRYGREELKLVDMYSPQSRSTLDFDVDGQRRRRHPKPNLPDMPAQLGFAFDVPSPDDLVFNARRGTSLAQRQ